MADRRLRYVIEAQDNSQTGLNKVVRSTQSAMKQVQRELDDGASAAEAFAAAVEAMADDIESDLRGSQRAIAALAGALGDELAPKAGEMVDQMRKAGVEFEDIEANADRLAGAMRRLDESTSQIGGGFRRGTDDMADGLDHVRGETDRARDSMGSFIGGAVGELPGVADAMGPIGEGLGQLAEGAFNAEVGMKQIVTTGALMAGVAAAVMAVVRARQQAAEAEAFHKERIDSLADSIRDGKSAMDAFRESVEEAGTIDLELFNEVEDVAPVLRDLGVDFETFSQLMAASRSEQDAWADAMIRSGASTDDVQLALAAVRQNADDLSQAQEAAATTSEVLGRSQQWLSDQLAATNDRLEENRRRNDEAREAERLRIEGVLGAADAQLALRDAERARQEAVESAAAATDDSTTAIDERAEAMDRAEAAALREVDAILATVEAHYGAATTAEDSQRRQIAALEQVAGQLDPNSPLRSRLQGYIDQLRSVPSSISTTVSMISPNFVKNSTAPSQVFGGARAAGGPTSAGRMYEVNENGSELLHEGGRTFLMAGSNGMVEPLAVVGAMGGSPISISGNFFGDNALRAALKEARRERTLRELGGWG